jgi:hypothetical protein
VIRKQELKSTMHMALAKAHPIFQRGRVSIEKSPGNRRIYASRGMAWAILTAFARV